MMDTAFEAATLPDLAAIRAAHARIAPHVHRTPVLTCHALDEEIGARLFFKCENFQKVGAFKARGASNAVFSLTDDEARRGVVTHSSGNHGAALAYAAARRGIPAWVVMPENASQVKQGNVRRYGATVRLCAPTVAAREAACADVEAATGAHARASVRRRAASSRDRRRRRSSSCRKPPISTRSSRRWAAAACFRGPQSPPRRCGRPSPCTARSPRTPTMLPAASLRAASNPSPTTATIADGLRSDAVAAHAASAARRTSPRSGSPRRKASCARCG